MAKTEAGVADHGDNGLSDSGFLISRKTTASLLPSEFCLSFAARFTPSICSFHFLQISSRVVLY